MTLVREHKKVSLPVVSRKSLTMIVWDTDRPTWTVRIPSARPTQVESAENSRLVQLAIPSGKELASIPVGFLPRVRYFPNEDRIIFTHDSTLGKLQVRIWDLGGDTSMCLEGRPAIEITGITPISEQQVVGLREKGRIHTFVRLSSDCSVINESAADPDSPGSMFYPIFSIQGPAIAPDLKTVAYIVRPPSSGPTGLILRRLQEDQSFQRIHAPEGALFWGMRFSPDSRLVVADTWQHGRGPGEPDARHRLQVYDVASGRLIRTLDIDARGGLAFSPDGRLLVVGTSSTQSTGFGGIRVKAIAVIYDFESARELARVEHPWFKTSPGMRGELTGLEFSADGRYLITSTHDVRVWRVESVRND